MKKCFTFILSALMAWPLAAQEPTQLTTAECSNMYTSAPAKARVSVHDPSVVYNPSNRRYYIFGSHQAWAYTSDMQNWTWLNSQKWSPNDVYTAFTTNQTKSVTVGGVSKTFGNFDAQAWASAYGDYNIAGNLWAPDVIYNKELGKWCQYLSVNGPNYNSVIIMLTADNIAGPYTYQGPVVYSGFYNTGVAALSWKNTDLPLVLGNSVTSLPDRYNISQWEWGFQWLNCIDPCVFYDQEGKLWMVYGSWFGGLWILHLDEATGLRDYDYSYGSDYASQGRNVTKDPYYGYKVHGGHWVSGEGPYIEYIGGYYYLFASYGGLSSNEGYQMRVFRSESPTGPYLDSRKVPAIYSGGANNYGINPDTRGEKLLGPYDQWGFQTLGELAQGHNSIIAAPDGRTYLIYHTRFNSGNEGHQVRVHQVFQNQDGWLVAAPFEYNGETVTDEVIATTQVFSKDDIVGTYQILVHKYSIDHENYEMVTPVKITLEANGRITGAYTGTWSVTEGTSYITLTMGGITYKGVVLDEKMDGMTIRSLSFTAAATSTGVNIWGYKMQDKYAVAWQVKRQTVPISNNQTVSGHVDLGTVDTSTDNVTVEWESDHPEIISNAGRYDPTGVAEDTRVLLTLRVSSGNYFWTQTYGVTAKAETHPTGDYYSGMLAHYAFDARPVRNSFDENQSATLTRAGSTVTLPELEEDPIRNGKVVHIYEGAEGGESFVRMRNPVYQSTLEDGITVAFWVKPTNTNLYAPFFAFQSGKKRFFLTGNSYVGFTDGSNNSIDINEPGTNVTGDYTPGKWAFVVLSVSREGGINYYINGRKQRFTKFAAVLDGATVNRLNQYDYNLIVDMIQETMYLHLGRGTTWGSPDARFDDVMVFNRVLSLSDVSALNTMANRVYDFREIATDIAEMENAPDALTPVQTDNAVYDLQGRRVATSPAELGKGIYIYRGKKILIR